MGCVLLGAFWLAARLLPRLIPAPRPRRPRSLLLAGLAGGLQGYAYFGLRSHVADAFSCPQSFLVCVSGIWLGTSCCTPCHIVFSASCLAISCGYALSQQQRQSQSWHVVVLCLQPVPRPTLRYSGVRAGAALVVRCYIVSVLTQVAKNGVWPDLAWDDIAQFFPHLVGERLLPAPACPASSSLDSPAPVSLALLVPPGHDDLYEYLRGADWSHGQKPAALIHLKVPHLQSFVCKARVGSSTLGFGYDDARASGRSVCERCIAKRR